MKITIFHNATAGEEEWPTERVMALCEELELEPVYLPAKDPEARQALRQASGIVVAIGGDGTIAKAARCMDREKASLLILPTGGANNIARSLGVYGHAAKILRGLSTFGTQPLYLGKLIAQGGVRSFVEAVGLGAIAALAAQSGDHLARQEKRETGRSQVIASLSEALPMRSAIRLDGAALEDPILAFEAMNIALIGPNLPLVLRAERAPDQIIAAWLPPERCDAMLAWLEDPHPGRCPMRTAAVRRIEVEPADHPVRVDDKLMEPLEPFRLRLRKRPVAVHIPKALP
jgi:diacylglycerol kinase family enzyme